MADSLRNLFEIQRLKSLELRLSTAAERKAKLRQLKNLIGAHEQEIFRALADDLAKPHFEAALTELYFVYGEIDFAIKHLEKWMRARKVPATLASLSTRNRIVYEPKGVSLIIAPWNYPFQLLIGPLVSAIAAGNCAILKPSELAPATSKLLERLINQNFDPSEIVCVEGDAAIARQLLELPFDHIFYTGSTQVGKLVMAAAAQNLSSVTLELGGKSPVIITETAQLEKAAEKIVWGKFLNAGQTCIAPDYVLVPATLEARFTELLIAAIRKFYYASGQLNGQEYGKIISQRHLERLEKLIGESQKAGAQLVFGGKVDGLVLEPTLIRSGWDTALMQEEIFGPVLPILSYSQLDEALAQVNARPKPLALYIFSDEKTARRIIRHTASGGAAVNEVLLHISNPHLPFGGSGHSGMGSCHGFYGFRAFSHERSVLYQGRFDLSRLVYPPFKTGLLKWLKKLF